MTCNSILFKQTLRRVCTWNREEAPSTSQRCTRAGPKPMVIFNPPQGTLKPRSQMAVKVSFTPPSEGVVEASAACTIKQAWNPLSLHIHGEGLTTHSQLAIEQQDGNALLLSSQSTQALDFGQVRLCAVQRSSLISQALSTPPPLSLSTQGCHVSQPGARHLVIALKSADEQGTC